MPDQYTANYNFVQPEVGASRDVWGTKHNTNLASLDTIIKALDNAKLAKAGDTATGVVNFQAGLQSFGNPVLNTLGVNAAIAAAIQALIPPGTIVLWSGAYGTIPAGWALCNGTNGTPDLRDKFVVGAGMNYNPGNTGGAVNHNHSGLTGGTTLTVNQMPSHSHNVSDPGHSHSVYDPQHVHSYQQTTVNYRGIQPGGASMGVADSGQSSTNTNNNNTGISIYNNNTGVSVQSNGGGQSHNHSISDADNRPPYYALQYIMKLAY